MKNKTTRAIAIILIFLVSLSSFSGCDEETWDSFQQTLSLLNSVLGEESNLNSLFGWDKEDENLAQVESNIVMQEKINSDLPSSIDLLEKFPPIGNQGSYGTCVAWAVGYNMRTFLYAVDNKLSRSQLTSSSNQFSPKYLFWAIPSNSKGSNCNGSYFEPAFDILVEQGCAPLSDVPYDDLGACDQSPSSSWNSIASDYKITNYRKITDENGYVSANDMRAYLSQKRAVVIGARLGENFMSWDSDDVLTSDTKTYRGQHAYHAMIVSGYDDNRGPNGAFRVVNSWDTRWGDDGYIWVDYNFFSNDFCFAAFVATGQESDPDDGNQVSGYDLVAWDVVDEPDPENGTRARKITYNAFNVGDETISASQDWNILYLYYNAYDANEYGIIVYDYYTDDYSSTHGDNAQLPEGEGYAPSPVNNWWTNIDIPPGQSMSYVVYGDDLGEVYRYNMPAEIDDADGYTKAMTGYYYLLTLVDGFDVISEYSEDNNYYFVTADDDQPIYIENGVIDGTYAKSLTIRKSKGRSPDFHAPSPAPSVRKGNPNSYSPEEIAYMIEHKKKTGELKEKVRRYLLQKSKTQNKGFGKGRKK